MALNRCKNGHMYSARKYGDTCPYCNTEIERVNLYSNTGRRTMIDDPDKTMPIMGTEENADPVTGWLVCIEGTQYGKDYNGKSKCDPGVGISHLNNGHVFCKNL